MEVEIDISFHCRKSFTTSWPQQQAECQRIARSGRFGCTQLVQSDGVIEGERQESIHTIRCTVVASTSHLCAFFCTTAVSRLLANRSTPHPAWLRAGVVRSEDRVTSFITLLKHRQQIADCSSIR